MVLHSAVIGRGLVHDDDSTIVYGARVGAIHGCTSGDVPRPGASLGTGPGGVTCGKRKDSNLVSLNIQIYTLTCSM